METNKYADVVGDRFFDEQKKGREGGGELLMQGAEVFPRPPPTPLAFLIVGVLPGTIAGGLRLGRAGGGDSL